MTKQLTLAGLLALQMTGCAYQNAMRQGGRAAAESDWRTAEAAYQKAAKAKDKPEALAAWQEAREAAIADALDQALIAKDAGNYESAMSEVAYIMGLDGDNADAVTMRRDVMDAMFKAIEDHWTLGNARTSYSTAVRMKALFPRDERLAPIFDRLRAHFSDQAEAELKAKRFEDALASARAVLEFEPDRKAHIAPLEHRILTGWADQLGKDAAAHAKAGRKGAAAFTRARAYEIAGRQEDLAAARDLARQLALTSRFDVDLKVTGAPTRAAAIQGAVANATGSLTDVGGATKDALVVTVTATGQSCTEEKQVTPESRDYISGQVEVPNPRHAELTAKLAQVQDFAAEAKTESERLWPEVQKAEQSMKFFDELVAMAAGQRDQAVAKVNQAQQQLARAEAQIVEINNHLAELRAVGPGTEVVIAKREQELAQVQGLIAQWQGAVAEAEFTAAQAERELQGLQIERQPSAEATERLQSGYQATLADWQRFERETSETRTALAATSLTLWEDVHETFRYDVINWTRTCTAPVTVALKPSWRTEHRTSERYTPVGVTRDTSHVGHEPSELVADPKAYPETDIALWSAADAETGKSLGAWIAQLSEEYYEVKTLETTMALRNDPMRGADALLGLYLGAPGHVDESTLLTFRSHAREHFGLENLELLRSETVSQLATR